jgi:NADH-quinone oxidoreductase subunit M
MQKLHNQCFLVLEVFILLCFCVSDALSFYIFFEATLLPMIIILGFWGGSERKIKAINMLWGYALLGSAPILLGILVLFTIGGCVEFSFLLHKVHIKSDIELFLFFCFFFGFSVKVPMFPFHTWLPEVHVEAPTAGSVILSGVLLKLGLYGIIRFCIILLPGAIPFFISFIQILCIISIILASLMCIKQFDFKKVIAYSSIVHMNIVIIGIFSGSTLTIGFLGSLISGITHCFASGSLFLLAGFLYERLKIREFPSIQGLYTTMPIYAFFLLLSALANSSFPGTFNFIGEIVMIYGIFASNSLLGLIAVLLTSLHVVYNILLFVKLAFGQTNNLKYIPQDLNLREIMCLFLFLF